MATLSNLRLEGTQSLHCNVLHELLCSPECVKCVCTAVMQTAIGCCVVVFVEQLELSQQPYTQ